MSKCDQLIEISNKLYNKHITEKQVDVLWRQYFHIALSYYGHSKRLEEELFSWCSDGNNWSALHIDQTEYACCSKDMLYSYFVDDADYISDRMSLDRLFRTHWFYWNWRKYTELHTRR